MSHLYPTLVEGREKQGFSVAIELPELPPEVFGVPDQQLLFLAVGAVGLWELLTLWGAVGSGCTVAIIFCLNFMLQL